ncbi:MAG: hypothetical protein PVF85_02080 [Anaerolineales bacterium]
MSRETPKVPVEPGGISARDLSRDAALPIAIRQINDLPENAKRRIFRSLLPPILASRFRISPITWRSSNGGPSVSLHADEGTGVVNLSVSDSPGSQNQYFSIELQDNAFQGIDLNLLVLSDPMSAYFRTDFDREGNETMFGTLHRNLDEEQRAMQAGLAPGQVRKGLGASKAVLGQLEAFLSTIGQEAYFLEPLTYASALIFERRGFAYVRGHQLMDEIHREFQPGGKLDAALDGSTPFRRPELSSTVRGRAWAIHDGVLEAIDANWDGLRMVKRIGVHSRVDTAPGLEY